MTARPQNRASVDSTIKTAAWIGPACGIASAVLYTLTNIALRNCVDVDAYLVAAVKATPTAIALGPVVGWMTLRNNAQNRKRAAIEPRPANHRRVVQFIAASFLAQFFGNAAFQKALERIGLAASVPITLGVLIVGGAILGAVLLKEPVSRNKVIAMVTLIIAVIVLSLPSRPGPSDSRPDSRPDSRLGTGTTSVTSETTPYNDQTGSADQRAIDVVFGSLWAALSGLAYSFFGVTMRQSLQTGIRSSTLMLISGLTGIVTLWPYCLATLGSGALLAISGSQWAIMAAAGILNFSAFIAITAALKLLPVVAVNLINASQVAMAAIAGVILFGEPITAPLGIGIFLTFIGLMVLARRTRATIVITD